MKEQVTKLKEFIFAYSCQIFIFIFFITVYLVTMYPGEGGRINYGDSIKWQYLHIPNGLPHGPGYPQFLIITEIFSRFVFFLDFAERITFISVFFGALSLVVFYSLLHLLTKNKTGSLITTFLTGFTYVFWTQATEAEVYTLNTFYLLSVFYLFIQFYLTKNSKYYLFGCAVYALSFGNHLSMITILPAIAFICLITDYKTVFAPKNLALVALFIFIGALQYGLVFYRAYTSDPLYMEIGPHLNPPFSQLLTFITGSDKSTMFAFTFNRIIFERFPILGTYLNENFTILGIFFAFAGFFYYLYVKKQYIILGFLSLALFGQMFFNISYAVPDLIVFFIPVYIILGIFIGLIFSASKKWISTVSITLLVFYLFYYNIKNKEILAKNTWGIITLRPVFSLYQEQKDNQPLYIKSTDYFMQQYMNYTLFAETLAPKRLASYLQLVQSDSFYIANDPAFYPELAEQYNIKLVVKEDISDFVQKRNKPNQVIFFSAMDEASRNLPQEFKDYMRPLGSKIDSISYGGSYAAVLYQGKLIEELSGEGPVTIKSKSLKANPLKGNIAYEILSAGIAFGNTSEIKINGFDYSRKARGMNMVVFDLQENKITDIVCYDTHVGTETKLFLATKKPPTTDNPELANHFVLKQVSEESLKDFVQNRSKPNTVIFFSARDEASQNLPREFVNYLKQYGSSIQNLPYRGAYGAILYNGKIREEINESGPATITSDNEKNDPLNGKLKYKIYSAGKPFGDNSEININNFDYSVKGRGLNLVVYDMQVNQVTDIASYDTHLGEEKNSIRAYKK